MIACGSTHDYRNTSYLLVRNSGESVIDELLLCAEAKNGKLKFQECIHLFRLKPGDVFKVALPGFPLEAIWAEEDSIFSSYESTEVFPIRLARDGNVEEFEPVAGCSPPTYVDALNPGWQRWDGKLYNTRVLEEAKQDLNIHLAHRFCGQYGLPGFNAKILLDEVLSRRRYRNLPGVLLYTLMANRWMLSLAIWTPLVLRIKQLKKFALDEDMRRATDYVLLRSKGARPIRVSRKIDA